MLKTKTEVYKVTKARVLNLTSLVHCAVETAPSAWSFKSKQPSELEKTDEIFELEFSCQITFCTHHRTAKL